MWIVKEAILFVVIILAASSESHPISLHNYAPAHEYKSTDYSFSYGVKDPLTGDVKNQWEEKRDNVVRGEYFVVEPDGTTRTVQYTADDKNGFNAVVKYDQHSIHPITKLKEAFSHNNLNLNPSKETAVVYSSYTNKVEELDPPDHSEVQTVVQHEYKSPESYSEIQNQAIQNFEPLTENERVETQQAQNQQLGYIYVPQQGITSKNNILEQTKSQSLNEKQVQISYAYESNQDDVKQQDAEQHESQQNEVKQIVETHEQVGANEKHTLGNVHAQLPLNLNILPDSTNKIPVDINSLNPIKIDLTKILHANQESTNGETSKYSTEDYSIQPSYQFTSEEVQKFIDDYNNKFGEPVYETGFVPITTKPNHLITQPMIPNTYKSSLKVNMTPGLKHYSSRGNKKIKRNKYEALLLGQTQLLPIFYTTGVSTENIDRNRSLPNRNQFIRTSKHIRFTS